MTAFPDQQHRDVIRGAAPGSLTRTVFVDAGAGTGKTTALVDRVVHLVRSGVPVREIAAITFTEAAASELRHRVRAAVEQAVATSEDADERQRLRTARAELDDAAFSTLHAFAQRILLDHPLEAALPPELVLLNDIEEAAAFEDRWDTWLATFVGREEIRPVLEHLDRLDIGIPRIRRLARALHDEYHRIPGALAVEPTGYAPPPLDLDELFAELDTLAALADGAAALDPDDKLVVSLRVWVAGGQALRDVVARGADLDEQLDALYALERTPLHPGGGRTAWGSQQEVSRVKAVRKALRDEVIPRVVRAQHDHVLRAMTAWTACFVLDWATERRQRGELVFQDLLVLARDLLRDDAGVRARVRGRHRHLLVDEFQDTDPVQIEIAVLLGAQDHDQLAADEDPEGSVPWERATLVPGRLFFVGDPKQSIYRFRGADIAVYEGAKSFVDGDEGEVRQLTHNFRSVPGVLDWVNAVFEQVLVARPRAQPAYHPLTAQRPAIPGAPQPAVHHIGGQGGTAEEVREQEARDVVRTVRALVGRVPVVDPHSGEERPARAADVAVLVRRHATARQLERCFDDVGLPLVVEARSLIFSSDEVRDLTTILTAIEDPNDQVAVLGALRHPAFGCSDADLVDWADAHGWWLPDPTADPDAHPVGRALHRLAVLRGDRQDHTVGGFVERVIAETHLSELVLAHPRYRDRWRRIRFVADQAHAFHEAGGHLRGFVRWLRDQAEEGVRRDEHVVPDADDDAVHVTTVHAAKGLEYPIVIVLGLDTMTDRPLHDATLLWGGEHLVEVNVASDAKTAGYEQLRDLEREFHREEEQRLLYVATTRARDRLVLSLHHGERNRSGCHAAALLDLADQLAPFWAELAFDEAGEGQRGGAVATPTPDGAGTPVGDDLADLATFAERHRSAAEAARRPRVLAATTIAGLLALANGDRPADGRDDAEIDGAEIDDAVDDRPQPWRKGRSGSAIGRAVHAVLQSIDLETLAGLDALARTQVAAEGLAPPAASEVAAMVRRAAGAPVVTEAVASGRYWRELHVGAPVQLDDGATITVEGFVDLLVETDEGLVVVDYKTDAVRDGVAPLLARYTPQAATYAIALEAALERPVHRCVFVLASASAGDDEQVEVAGDDLATATSSLHEALRAMP